MPSRRPVHIEPPHLTKESIHHKADQFRNENVDPPDLLPIPIELIIEIKLGLQIIPKSGLFDRDIDGFLTKDLTSICVDYGMYMNPRKENRLRFTYAHEVGHFVLHQNEIRQCNYRTPDGWMHFYDDFRKEDLDWFEWQAREFAGRLLVPKAALESEIRNMMPQVEEYRRRGGSNGERIIDIVARAICNRFRVSPQVVSKRIDSEGLSRILRRPR
jgi:hypothetical protein